MNIMHGMYRTEMGLYGLGSGPLDGCCERGNEPSYSFNS